MFLVEGLRSVEEALAQGAQGAVAVVSPRLAQLEGGSALGERLASAVELHRVEDQELSSLSATESPQGVLLVCWEPASRLMALEVEARARSSVSGIHLRLLVVDGIQDPGNLGTLVRAAAAFALSGVIVFEGGVDPYNPKAVRGAAGALFRIPLVRAQREEAVDWLTSRGVRLLVADGRGTDVGTADLETPWALVVGNEGAGVTDAVRRAAAQTLAVPMPGGTDSLNAGVAGAVLLYALTRENRGD